MKVVILATAIGPTNAGAGQYARQLLPHLLPLLANQGARVSVLLSKGGALPAQPKSVHIVRLPEAVARNVSRILLEQVCPSLLTWRGDVFLSLDSRFPFAPLWAKRNLVVMHDVHLLRHLASPAQYPMDHTRRALAYFSAGMKKAIRAAHRIITDSRFIADELKNLMGVRDDRMSVIPCGLDHQRFHPQQDSVCIEQVRKRYTLPQDFYLFVGQPSTQKNLRLIVETYASAGLNPELRLPVVIAWDMRRSELFEPTLGLIRQSGLNELFRFVGYVADEDLASLYGSARALLYTSLYEGFGLPPLEAMACGIPVVASDRASLPEVVGDAAILIDPLNPQSLAEALRKVDQEETRTRLISKGLERARAFSWERTAQQVAERFR
jgi:glycosyltransferase involved in cell wall biosynthesis